MRLIDADALKKEWSMANKCEECPQDARKCQYEQDFSRMDICEMLDEAPTVGGWISVKDRLPSEHDSLFAKNPHLSKYMWAKESDDVIVYAVFPDGTGRATEGRLRDGKWNTKISPMLESVITHWMSMPEAPKDGDA